jgi:hypothetical protein
MRKQRLAIAALAAGLVFITGLLLGIWFQHWAAPSSAPRIYNTSVILRQVQTLSQLVTVKYVMEKIEILEDPSQNPLRYLWPTYDNTRVILVAHGIVKAGVDLAALGPDDLRISGNKIVLRLPRPQITDAYLDDQKTQIIEHTTGFLRAFNKDLEQATRQNAIDDIRRAARNNGILKDADERARLQLKALLLQLGFGEVEFSNDEAPVPDVTRAGG